jgi:hypothetical protein
MNFLRLSLIAFVTSAFTAPAVQAQPATATTDPVGFVTVNVAAGTGTARTTSFVSIPMLETPAEFTGQAAGQITGVTASTLSNSSAGWAPGALSSAAAPYLIQLTSGAAAGRMFLISSASANTATTVTINADDVAQGSLDTLGIAAGNTYRIFPCDTLSSFFGAGTATATQGKVLGGATARVADNLTLVVNGLPKTYFYSTTLNRWAENRPGTPDASNVALRPYYGVQYSRLAAVDGNFVATGTVPTSARSVAIKNSGVTQLSVYWPVDNTTLAGLGLQTITGWVSGANARVADTVILQTSAGAVPKTYLFNGTNWVENRPGFPVSNTVVIPLGASVQVSKRGSAAGYSKLDQIVPYNL